MLVLLGLSLFFAATRAQDDDEGGDYDGENDNDDEEEAEPEPAEEEEEDADAGPQEEEEEEEEEDEEEEEVKEEEPTDIPSMLSFDMDSEEEHMRNFKKISADLFELEQEYSECIRDIPDLGYTQARVEDCLGRNFMNLVLDIKYETLKIISRADARVRRIFMENCYEFAGTEEEFSVGCDLMERDTLDLMWNGMDFVTLLETNKEKYMREYSKIPYDEYHELLEKLGSLSKEFFELLDEVDTHKELTILRIKTLIDERSRLIIESVEEEPAESDVPTEDHEIEITEELIEPEDMVVAGEADIDNLPPPQVLNSDPKDFGETPEVEQVAEERKLRGVRKPVHIMPKIAPFPVMRKPGVTTAPQVKRVLKHGPALSPKQELERRKRQLYQTSHYRMFNHGKPYASLHAASAPTKKVSMANVARRPRIMGLRPSERIGDVKYKSVHTTHPRNKWMGSRSAK